MRVVIAVADLLARTRLEEAARAAGHDVALRRSVPDPAEPPPDLLVADLDQPGALDAVERYTAAHPSAAVAGLVFHIAEDTIAKARALGVRTYPHGADPASVVGARQGR